MHGESVTFVLLLIVLLINMNEYKRGQNWFHAFVFILCEGNKYRYLPHQTMPVAIFLTSAKQILRLLPFYGRALIASELEVFFDLK